LVQDPCAVDVVVVAVAKAVAVAMNAGAVTEESVAMTSAAGHLKPVPIKTIELFHQF
jgi:3-dehydroquinate dehydratase